MGKETFRARQNHLGGSAILINYLEYGTKTHIAPGNIESFYLFQFPLRGGASICNGNDHYEIGGGTGSILNPDCDTRMIWDETCAQLMVQVDRRTLERQARAFFSLPEERRIRFAGPANLTGGMGLAFLNLLSYVIQEAAHWNIMIGCESLMSRQLEQSIIVGLLDTIPHNLKGRPVFSEARRGPAPKIIRTAEAYIEEHLQENISVSEIADTIGVSVRTLQATFRFYQNCTPLEYIRYKRLERTWVALSNPMPETTVTDTATA